MALMDEPSLLIMDEPTTGLDVTVEAAVLDLVRELRHRHNSSILFISHNLGTVVRVCDRIGVMYAGELVEEGPITEVFRDPSHPYTRGLLNAIPTLNADKHSSPLTAIPGQVPPILARPKGCVFAPRCIYVEPGRCTSKPIETQFYGETGLHRVKCVRTRELPRHARPTAANGNQIAPTVSAGPMLQIGGLAKAYHQAGSVFGGGGYEVHAVDGIDLEAGRGTTLAIVGESGCGKSTFAKVLTGIEQSTGGGAFTQVATVGAGVTNFTVTGLTASTAYSYRVRATNSAGDSAYSNTASATTQAAPAPAPTPAPPTATAPASPTNLAAAASSGSITLTWSDNSDNETSFRLDRASDGVNFTQIATINADVTSYADTSVTAGTTYTYRIKAINSVGGSVWSNLASATASGTTPTPPPSGKPASTGATLTATASTGRITLAWADKSNNESGFWIERSTDGKSFSKLTQTVADVTSFVDTSVVAGVTYTYRIRAFNSSGNSVWSNLASAKAV